MYEGGRIKMKKQYGFINVLGMALGLPVGVSLVFLSKDVSLKIYSLFGITTPICIGNSISCQVSQALFNCSLYLLAIGGAALLALEMGIPLSDKPRKQIYKELFWGICHPIKAIKIVNTT